MSSGLAKHHIHPLICHPNKSILWALVIYQALEDNNKEETPSLSSQASGVRGKGGHWMDKLAGN